MQLSADGVPNAYAVGLTETVATTLDETGILKPSPLNKSLPYSTKNVETHWETALTKSATRKLLNYFEPTISSQVRWQS